MLAAEHKMDFGKNFFDGKRVFGNNKTFRGFFFGLAVGMMVGLMEVTCFPFSNFICLLIPLGAFVRRFDGCVLKRRMGIAPGGLLPIVDQVDFVIGAIVLLVAFSHCELAIGRRGPADYAAYSFVHEFLSLQVEAEEESLVKTPRSVRKSDFVTGERNFFYL